MSIHVEWEDETHKIITFTYHYDWTIEDIHRALKQANELAAGVDYPIAIMSDIRDSGPPPPGLLGHLKNLLVRQHENVVFNVVVSSNQLWLALGDVFSKLYGSIARTQSVRFVHTKEEAITLAQANLQ